MPRLRFRCFTRGIGGSVDVNCSGGWLAASLGHRELNYVSAWGMSKKTNINNAMLNQFHECLGADRMSWAVLE